MSGALASAPLSQGPHPRLLSECHKLPHIHTHAQYKEEALVGGSGPSAPSSPLVPYTSLNADDTAVCQGLGM